MARPSTAADIGPDTSRGSTPKFFLRRYKTLLQNQHHQTDHNERRESLRGVAQDEGLSVDRRSRHGTCRKRYRRVVDRFGAHIPVELQGDVGYRKQDVAVISQ